MFISVSFHVVWASTYKTNLRRLVTLQKRAVRIINNSNFDAHTDPIFKELSILKFNDIHLLQLGQFIYSYKSSSLPLKFTNKFLQNSQFHNYNTRNSHALHLPYCQTNVKKTFLCFSRDLNFITLLIVKSSIQTQFTPLRKPLTTKLLITMSKILLASVSNVSFCHGATDNLSHLSNFNWFN